MTIMSLKTLTLAASIALVGVATPLHAGSGKNTGSNPPMQGCTTPPPKRLPAGDRNETRTPFAAPRPSAKDCNGGVDPEPPGTPTPVFDPICGTRCQQN